MHNALSTRNSHDAIYRIDLSYFRPGTASEERASKEMMRHHVDAVLPIKHHLMQCRGESGVDRASACRYMAVKSRDVMMDHLIWILWLCRISASRVHRLISDNTTARLDASRTTGVLDARTLFSNPYLPCSKHSRITAFVLSSYLEGIEPYTHSPFACGLHQYVGTLLFAEPSRDAVAALAYIYQYQITIFGKAETSFRTTA